MSDDKLDKIENKLDRLDTHLANIDVTLAKQAVILDSHVKRTNLLEAQIEPIKKHVAMVNGALKLLGLVCAMAAAAEAVITIVEFLKHL